MKKLIYILEFGQNTDELKAIEMDEETAIISNVECDYDYYFVGKIWTKLVNIYDRFHALIIQADTENPTDFDKDFSWEDSLEMTLDGYSHIIKKIEL